MGGHLLFLLLFNARDHARSKRGISCLCEKEKHYFRNPGGQ